VRFGFFLPRLIFILLFLQFTLANATPTPTEEGAIFMSSGLTCDLNLSAVCASCDEPGCSCLTGSCVGSVCVCTTPTSGDFCERVPQCTMASYDSVTTIYRWWWAFAFAVTAIGVHTIAFLSIRRGLRRLSPKMLLKTPLQSFLGLHVRCRYSPLYFYGRLWY
jgi:hypothetical protein